ncbi:class I SAM-dependent methyltransferase [Clostridium oryzae]|uniref:Putative S-adenosylmethionine-dependent methyltransferase n=1 Tax=Clostridium oryzae TaxID=1450648 RepID=A0A1V4IXJ2_9CLOT|nr:class I SAM-dependent methyltransferase [Clostridium oryzae]OPJ64613.1 putative S-adenosylmethionine-dependent methyltransferase [Clostridium oryzae]
MKQQEYWNKVSTKKKFTTPFHSDEFSKYVCKSNTILDVGCGYGRTLNELYQLGYHNLIGIDFSDGMIEQGRKQFPYLNLRVKKEARIDLPDNSIDAVILFAVLTCIYDNNEHQFLIHEIKRILKPNGILYVNDFLLNSDERNIKRYQKFQEKYGTYGIFELPEGAICRHHSEDWIHNLLTSFTTLKYQHLTFTTMNGNKSNGFYYIGRKN